MEDSRSRMLRIALTKRQVKKIKVKAAEADKPVSQFLGDYLAESLGLEERGNGDTKSK